MALDTTMTGAAPLLAMLILVLLQMFMYVIALTCMACSPTFASFISETDWFAFVYACSIVGSILRLISLVLLIIHVIYTWYAPPRLSRHPRVLRRMRGRIYMHNGAVSNMRGLVLYKELPTSQPLSNELKQHLRFPRYPPRYPPRSF